MKNRCLAITTLVLNLIILTALTSVSVYAEPPPAGYRVDNRYHQERYYPRHGHTVDRLPQHHYSLHYHDRRYFYYGGVWYQPTGPRFVVVAPPLGIVVPFLPPFYSTVWIAGTPYYYANDTYYVWRPDLSGYQVTSLPPQAPEQEPNLSADQLFIYPKKGQSEKQLADDRFECYRWSVGQTGYDPIEPPENLSQSALNAKREDYQRAMKTCLDGRGYSVR